MVKSHQFAGARRQSAPITLQNKASLPLSTSLKAVVERFPSIGLKSTPFRQMPTQPSPRTALSKPRRSFVVQFYVDMLGQNRGSVRKYRKQAELPHGANLLKSQPEDFR